MPFETKMDRSRIVIADSNDELDDQDIEYWRNATIMEKFQTMTYLRECFYGPEATTGRVQRFHTILELRHADCSGHQQLDGKKICSTHGRDIY